MTDSSQKKQRHESDPPENPFHDPLRQELGYKLDKRYIGCLLIVLAVGVLVAAISAFLFYWLFPGP